MSWVLYRVKSMVLELPRVSRATVRSLREGGNFTYSKSFIMALNSRRPGDLCMGLLLAECVCLSERFPPPRHLYYHQEGTILDVVLDVVDNVAQAQAQRQPHPMPAGYIGGLQPSQPSCCKDGVQWHDASIVQDRLLQQHYAA